MERIITVFGSSRPRENEADYEEAVALGRALGEAGFAVFDFEIVRHFRTFRFCPRGNSLEREEFR